MQLIQSKFRKSKISLLVLSTLASQSINAGVMRHDIDVQTYRDFAENRGVFQPGATNVPVYKTDGTLSGTVAHMPDFSATNDSDTGKMTSYNGGYSTVFNPSYGISVAHVPYTDNLTWARRFYIHNDGTLFNGSDKNENYYKLGETTKRAVDNETPGFDYKFTRYRSVVTEVAPTEMLSSSETKALLGKALGRGALLARAGGGVQVKAVDGSTAAAGCGEADGCYGWLSGGLNQILWHSIYGERMTYTLAITNAAKTALDIGTKGGDSGSPVYWWDEAKQKWWLIAANQAGGGGEGYAKDSYLRSAPEWTEKRIASYIDAPINTTSTTSSITWQKQDTTTGEGKLTVDGKEVTYHGLATVPEKATDAETQAIWAKSKDLIFGGQGGTINVTDGADINMGAGSLTFNQNFILGGNGRLNSAGYIVNKGATLTSTLTGQAGDTWRKIGEGTFRVQGSSNNEAELNIGDGTTYLERQNGYAASHIRLASGRGTVVLKDENQLKITQDKDQTNTVGFAFGTRGGILDLNGTSPEWNDIYHLDTGATITNNNANKASTFSFAPHNGTRTFLGAFNDKNGGTLNVTYAPKTKNSEWRLKGNSEIKGNFNLTSGQIVLGNYYTPHAANYVDDTDFQSASFKAGKVEIADGTKFTVARKAKAEAAFNVQNNAILAVDTVVGSLDPKQPQQGLQEGAVLNGTVTLAQGAQLTSEVEKDFTTTINADVTGGTFTKYGKGTAVLNGKNSFNQARIEEGQADVADIKSLGNTAGVWSMSEAGVLNAMGNTNKVSEILNVIANDTRGVLAFSGKLADYISAFNAKPNLYLGSTTTLELGETNKTLNNDQLRLGGAKGTVTVLGNLKQDASLAIGNAKQTGKVVIASHNPDFNGTVTVGNVELDTQFEDSLGRARISLGYAAMANANLMKNISQGNETEGVLLVNQKSDLTPLANYERVAIGVKEGEKVTLTKLDATKSGYRFGGKGELVLNTKLTGNHNVTVDGQGYTGGEITLIQANDFKGNITVQGHREIRVGDITLNISNDNALGKGNTLNLVRNGVLKLNANTSVELGQNDESATIKNSTETVRKLELTTSTSGEKVAPFGSFEHLTKTLSAALSGKLHLVKAGEGNLRLATNGSDLTNVDINQGMLSLEHAQAVGADTQITVNNDAILNTGAQSAGNVVLNTNGSRTSLLSTVKGIATLNSLTLAKNNQLIDFNDVAKTASAAKKERSFYVKNFDFNGNTLTLQNADLVLNSKVVDSSKTAGKLVLNAASASANSQAAGFFDAQGTLELTNGSVLDLRDYSNAKGTAKKEVILNNSSIGVSHWAWNGGGGASNFNNNITFIGNSSLRNSNGGFGTKVTFSGNLAGEKNAVTQIAGHIPIALTGDISKFYGKFSLAHKLLEIDGADGQIVNAGFTQGANVKNHGFVHSQNKSLIIAGDNSDFTGSISQTSANGKLTLRGAQAMPVLASELNAQAGEFVFDLAKDEQITLDPKRSGAGTFVKAGAGVLRFANMNNTFSGDYRVENGTLALANTATVANAKSISAQKDATLQLDFNSTEQVNFNLIGAGNLLKTGSAAATFKQDMSYTGLTTIDTGSLATKNLAGSLQVNPQGVFYMAQQAVEIAGNLVNKGLVYLNSQTGTSVEDRLRVGGNYVGERGSRLVFDTTLYDDNSATDKLMINGDAKGQSTLSVRNFNGKGALTPVGINLINIKGQSEAQFNLDQRYTAGAFEYVLLKQMQGNEANWLLTSVIPKQNGLGVTADKPTAATPVIQSKGTSVTADKPTAATPVIQSKGASVTADKPTAATPVIQSKGTGVTADKPTAATPVIQSKGTGVTVDKPIAATPVVQSKGSGVTVLKPTATASAAIQSKGLSVTADQTAMPIVQSKGTSVTADKQTATTPVIQSKGTGVTADKPTAATPATQAKGDSVTVAEKAAAELPVMQPEPTQRILRSEVGAYLAQLDPKHKLNEFMENNNGQSVWLSAFGEQAKSNVEASQQLEVKSNSTGINIGANLFTARNWRIGVLLGAEKQTLSVDPTYTVYKSTGKSIVLNTGFFVQYAQDEGVQFSSSAVYHWDKHQVKSEGFRDDYHSKGISVNTALGYRFIMWDKQDFELGLMPKVMYNLESNRMAAHRDMHGNQLSSTGLSQEVGTGITLSVGTNNVTFSTSVDYYKPTEKVKLNINETAFTALSQPYAESHTRLQWQMIPNVSLQTDFKKRFGNERNREVSASLNYSF
ncbi:autotransporter outer membrane beta-barrel domain-containing protein [Actinobacillus equuli subsp. haemolyticus]|uniref:S6 family peptidase n=1 Tax=Actinobacillus equuli TaxID=718 RepID=UPI0024427443|nr:S6 family peptidase [Actinobacillus equuli]WGE66817.1 autotransporter outer membrane beta-barrel domain-containing protein [Actinobacillus equuli subsp. haemolyticus]